MLASSPVTESSPFHRTRAAPPNVGGTLHAVAPIDLPGVKPGEMLGLPAPIVEHMRPSDLLVDEAYQRDLSPKSLALIRRIVEGWDWLKFKPPVVAMTDAGFEVVDGQHTAIAAACHPSIETIPVLVVDGSDLQRRAAAFVSHAVDRLQATPAQVWHAAVAAGDPDALTIRNVLDRAGVTLLPYPPARNVFGKAETVALGAVRRLVDQRGAMRAREVLEILARAELAPITADHVRIAEALLLDPEYAGGLDVDRITVAIRDVTPKQLAEAKEVAFAKRLSGWRALTAVLYRANTGPRRRSAKAPEAAPPSPMPVASTGKTHLRGVGDIPTPALLAGIAAWRQGGPWPAAWGVPPGHPECAVPGSLLGGVLMLAGTARWEIVVERAVALWGRDGEWPDGWGPPPSDPDCAVPSRLRAALTPA